MKSLKLDLTAKLDSLGIKHIHLTQLTKYIWRLSKDKIQYKIKWNNPTYASPYKCGSRRCDLCLTEKFKTTSEDLSFCGINSGMSSQ